MPPKVPRILAGVAYAVFATFGILVWHVLTFVALPKETTPLNTLISLLSLEPGAFFMRLHLSLVLSAVALAAILVFKPPLSIFGKRTLLALSLAFAVVSCFYLSLDTADLPVLGFLCVAWAYWPALMPSPREA